MNKKILIIVLILFLLLGISAVWINIKSIVTTVGDEFWGFLAEQRENLYYIFNLDKNGVVYLYIFGCIFLMIGIFNLKPILHVLKLLNPSKEYILLRVLCVIVGILSILAAIIS